MRYTKRRTGRCSFGSKGHGIIDQFVLAYLPCVVGYCLLRIRPELRPRFKTRVTLNVYLFETAIGRLLHWILGARTYRWARMASTTPTTTPSYRRTRSKSPRSRPTTPLRASSRSSLRDSSQRGRAASASGNALEGLQDGFAELSDAMADLEQNFLQLQLMHESLARFSESFAGFLYGMNMNAFCVDFPEVRDKRPKRGDVEECAMRHVY